MYVTHPFLVDDASADHLALVVPEVAERNHEFRHGFYWPTCSCVTNNKAGEEATCGARGGIAPGEDTIRGLGAPQKFCHHLVGGQ